MTIKEEVNSYYNQKFFYNDFIKETLHCQTPYIKWGWGVVTLAYSSLFHVSRPWLQVSTTAQ